MQQKVEDIVGDPTLGGFLSEALPKRAKPLGTGAFSVVVAHPRKESRVIKVTYDEGAFAYLTAELSSRHAPKVFRAAPIGRNALGMPVFAIEMERLLPYEKRRDSCGIGLKKLRRQIVQLASAYDTDPTTCEDVEARAWADVFRWLARRGDWPVSIRRYFGCLSQFFADWADFDGMLHGGATLVFDRVHRRNLGLRADGTPVFLDPVYASEANEALDMLSSSRSTGRALLRLVA